MCNKIKLAVLVMTVLIAGCETVASVDKGGGVYAISSSVEALTPGIPLRTYAELKRLSKENCPTGWALLSEETEIREGKEYILQTIQCKTAKSS